MNDLITLDKARPEVQRKFMAGVYLRMVLALAITAAVAYFVAYKIQTDLTFQSFFFKNINPILWGSFIAELAVVFVLSFYTRKISSFTAMFLFILYSVITGITFSTVFIIFEIDSIFKVFLISGLMFLGMSIYGIFTQADLRSAGRYLVMALIGLCAASLLNLLFRSPAVDWIISLAGVGIFVGLTAYDTQKIMTIAIHDDGSEKFQKYAIIGALELYLDFINIFIKMLNLFGKRKK
ncbi:MAG: Bax inhibitor-1/YccA family protein [Treponema sp.]